MTQVALSTGFLEAFAKIPRQQQKKVRAFVEKFKADPTQASINYESLHDMADDKVRVWAIPAKTGGSRAFCDRMNGWAQKQGQPGLGYIFFREGEGAGPIAKNIGEDRTAAVREQLGLEDGDAVFFVCGKPDVLWGSPYLRIMSLPPSHQNAAMGSWNPVSYVTKGPTIPMILNTAGFVTQAVPP